MRAGMRRITAVFVGMVAVTCVAFAQAPPPVPAPVPAEPELFVPSLALIKEKEGKYTLVALAYMPNSCYRAILAKEGFPAKEKEPDAEGIQIIIKSEPGKLCAKMRWPVIQQLAGLKPGKGKNMIWVYVVEDGKVQGKAKVSLSSARDGSSLVGVEIPAPF
jgi:hypothetical protein